MGLCKCRNVTNLFCFEHRKNVCETCLLSSHSYCVVKSYLSWLQDSDYSPECSLCLKVINTNNIPTRLKCLDLFHTECLGTQLIPNLDKECSKLPKTTTSLGYLCPTCNDQIIPSGNDNSLIANQIRTNLGGLDWFKACQVLKVTPEVVEVKSPEVVQPAYSSGIIPSTKPFQEESRITVDPDDASYKQKSRSQSQFELSSLLPRRPPTIKRLGLYVVGFLVLLMIYGFLNRESSVKVREGGNGKE